MEDILVPLGICVALPVLVVWIIYRAVGNNDNRRAEVLLKALDSNNVVDTEQLVKAFSKPRRTPRELLNLRLLRGCVFTLIGVFIEVFLVIIGACEETVMMEPLFLIGGIAILPLAIGVGYLVVYFVTRKQVVD